MKHHHILVVSTAVIFYSCSSCPPNLSAVKQQVDSYYKSGAYENELIGVLAQDIDDFPDVMPEDSFAVVFDVDETVLSNYQIIEMMDFGYMPEVWDEWINSESAVAIIPVKTLYDTLVERGYHIIFITGRKDYHYMQTLNNLMNEGFRQFDTLIVRTKNEYELSAEEYKTAKRIELINKSYKIAGSVGDQWSDLKGSYVGIRVKLPNYLYGID